MSEKIELTRRRVLAGLGTVGVASAGAGLGTSAYFSDTESFEDNQLTAGTLDLRLEGNVVWTNRTDSAAPAIDEQVVSSEGQSTMLVDFQDVKPGDCYVVQTDEIISGNPAYLQMSLAETGDSENGTTEPESDAADPDASGGELDDEMMVSLWYGGNDITGSLYGDESGESVDKPSITTGSGVPTKMVGEQSLQDAFDGLAQSSDDAPGDAGLTDDFVPKDGDGHALKLDPGRWRKFWVFCLPQDVGNEVQGDSVTFTITGEVVQARNNPDDSAFQ